MNLLYLSRLHDFGFNGYRQGYYTAPTLTDQLRTEKKKKKKAAKACVERANNGDGNLRAFPCCSILFLAAHCGIRSILNCVLCWVQALAMQINAIVRRYAAKVPYSVRVYAFPVSGYGSSAFLIFFSAQKKN